MKLIEALDLEGERIIALAGGGGKTASLYLLGRELAEQGKKVVLAASARMYPPGPEIPLLLENRSGIIGERTAELLNNHNQVLVGAGMEGGKLIGLSCPLLLELAGLSQVDYLITEADGSRGLPLKFAAEHEPVVCSEDTLVVPVLGISALGARLNKTSFHRWELATKHLGVQDGTEITPQLAAAALLHPLSYGRFLGKNRVVPLLNQVETRAQEDGAWQVARLLLAESGIERVILGAVQTEQPVRAVVHQNKGERQ